MPLGLTLPQHYIHFLQQHYPKSQKQLLILLTKVNFFLSECIFNFFTNNYRMLF